MAITKDSDVTTGFAPAAPAPDPAWVNDLITEAEMELEARIGDLSEWIFARGTEASARRKEKVVQVVKRMVRRVLRNPEGYQTETAGDYSYSRSRETRSGQVYASTADLRLLGVRRNQAKSIRIGLPADSPRNQIRRRQ